MSVTQRFFPDTVTSGRRLNRVLLVCCAVILTSVLAGCAGLVRPNYTQILSELRSGDYLLDPEHAYVHFRIEHLGLSTVIGRFNAVRASLDFDPKNIAAMRLDGVVDVSSIDLNNSDLEDRLRGANWFDAAQFPEATFETQTVQIGEGDEFVITGSFTLRGITRPMALAATFKGGADNLLTGKYTLGFAAMGSFLRSDYGIDGFAALVADEVFIELNAEFQRADQ